VPLTAHKPICADARACYRRFSAGIAISRKET
jgi:hypothetical protein